MAASSQMIRYSGRSTTGGAGALTGIPVTGPGAITANILPGTAVVALSTLTGIPASGAGAITQDLVGGEDVNLVVQRDDAARQAALAALIGGDGIQEDWIQDRRLSLAEAAARGDAALELDGDPETRLAWRTRDRTARAGRSVAFDLGAPTSVSGTYQVQRVTISDLGISETVYPLREVEASSKRYSFEDLLRRIRGRAA